MVRQPLANVDPGHATCSNVVLTRVALWEYALRKHQMRPSVVAEQFKWVFAGVYPGVAQMDQLLTQTSQICIQELNVNASRYSCAR